jgi:hypothetical protein
LDNGSRPHVRLRAGVELLIDAPMESGDLAFNGGDPILKGSDLIIDTIEAYAHVGAYVLHALDDELRQLFDRVDLLRLFRTASTHTKEFYHAG